MPLTVLSIVIIIFHSILIKSYEVDSGREKLMAISVLFFFSFSSFRYARGFDPWSTLLAIYFTKFIEK